MDPLQGIEARQRDRSPRARSREMAADDLNDMSLALIRRGNMGPNRDGAESNISRAMGYKKGGKVSAKRK